MSETDNIRIAEKFFEAVNAHDLSRFDEYYASDYTFAAPGAPGALNSEQSKAYTQGFINAFPDLHFAVQSKFGQGDYVAVTWVATGRHTGNLVSPNGDVIPPTGQKASVTGCTIYQFKNGKVFRGQTYWDMVTLLVQLGLMPEAQPAR